MAEGDIFERYETKYLMDRAACDRIMETVRMHMELDRFGHSLICNLYYDTPDYLLIRRSLDHPVYKEKLRVRSYGVAEPGGTVFIELKKKYCDVVYKRRVTGREDALAAFFAGADSSQIAREICYAYRSYPALAPRVYISYEREAYYPKNGDSSFRVTFDENIRYRTDELSLQVPPRGTPVIGEDQVLMELKCADSIPFWMVRALSEAGIYQASFSKYGKAYLDIIGKGADYDAAV